MNIINSRLNPSQTILLSITVDSEIDDDDFEYEFNKLFPEIRELIILDSDLMEDGSMIFFLEVRVYECDLAKFLNKFISLNQNKI